MVVGRRRRGAPGERHGFAQGGSHTRPVRPILGVPGRGAVGLLGLDERTRVTGTRRRRRPALEEGVVDLGRARRGDRGAVPVDGDVVTAGVPVVVVRAQRDDGRVAERFGVHVHRAGELGHQVRRRLRGVGLVTNVDVIEIHVHDGAVEALTHPGRGVVPGAGRVVVGDERGEHRSRVDGGDAHGPFEQLDVDGAADLHVVRDREGDVGVEFLQQPHVALSRRQFEGLLELGSGLVGPLARRAVDSRPTLRHRLPPDTRDRHSTAGALRTSR